MLIAKMLRPDTRTRAGSALKSGNAVRIDCMWAAMASAPLTSGIPSMWLTKSGVMQLALKSSSLPLLSILPQSMYFIARSLPTIGAALGGGVGAAAAEPWVIAADPGAMAEPGAVPSAALGALPVSSFFLHP